MIYICKYYIMYECKQIEIYGKIPDPQLYWFNCSSLIVESL